MQNISHRTERHHLTTLQRQLMKWLKTEGGGALPADRLFTSMVNSHTMPEAGTALLGDRFCEAVDTLCRKGYAEVRLESEARGRKKLSLYDFGAFGKNVQKKSGGWMWKKGECPTVALTDDGVAYADVNL